MFKGEKQRLFWIGLIILAFAAVNLFSSLWDFVYYIERHADVSYMVRESVPVIVAAVVFMFIGLYMMKSGTKSP